MSRYGNVFVQFVFLDSFHRVLLCGPILATTSVNAIRNFVYQVQINIVFPGGNFVVVGLD